MELLEILKNTSFGRLPQIIFMFWAMALFYVQADAQTTKRVTFVGGQSTVAFNDTVLLGQQDTYVIKLKKGENLEVDVNWRGRDVRDEGQGLAGYTIVFPNGKKLVDPQDGFFTAGASGDYRIIVSPRTKKTNYRYRITFGRS